MVCGTASDVGKSRIVTGLCRLYARRGVRVAPFKAQNMALNSFVTADGAEIGRSQASQAMAAGVEPEVAMNPVLLKPTGPDLSQVVVMGRPVGHLEFGRYRARAAEMRAVVHDALADLRGRFDVVVCEGAGGAAEVNLLDGDIVNLPLAHAAGVPAVLVGDIERGGVFAALHGTVDLLPAALRAGVRGFVINKMRGDPGLLASGTDELWRRHGIPTLGVVPYVDGVFVDAEDSLALQRPLPSVDDGPGAEAGEGQSQWLDVAVVALPHMANFTDLDPLMLEPGVTLRFVRSPALGDPDLIVVPGTKATVADLRWLNERGIARAIVEARARPSGPVILGVCGGYQMLGRSIDDAIESAVGRVPGVGLLDVDTVFEPDKVTRRRQGTALGATLHGYQIHHGRVRVAAPGASWIQLVDDGGPEAEGGRTLDGRVLGTTLHGLFEDDGFRGALFAEVARLRGRHRNASPVRFAARRQAEFDLLADTLEAHLDIETLDTIVASASLG